MQALFNPATGAAARPRSSTRCSTTTRSPGARPSGWSPSYATRRFAATEGKRSAV